MRLSPTEFTLTPEEYDALTRVDFWIFVQRVFLELTGRPFLDNWHIQKLCAEVDRIRTEPNTRLAIALPPRSLKSIIASVALPAWLLGHHPGIEVVCVSYGQELADMLAAQKRQETRGGHPDQPALRRAALHDNAVRLFGLDA